MADITETEIILTACAKRPHTAAALKSKLGHYPFTVSNLCRRGLLDKCEESSGGQRFRVYKTTQAGARHALAVRARRLEEEAIEAAAAGAVPA